MIDPTPLESELRQLRPVPLTAEFRAKLSAALAAVPQPARLSLADRIFAGTLVSGLAAACVVLAIVVPDLFASRSSVSPVDAAQSSSVPTIADTPRFLAQDFSMVPIRPAATQPD